MPVPVPQSATALAECHTAGTIRPWRTKLRQALHRLGELGYSTIRPAWGKGVATEAVVAVVERAFSTLDELNRVRAMPDARNLASQRVLIKAGFTQKGTLRQNHVVRGEPIDEVWFGLLRVEWRTPRSA